MENNPQDLVEDIYHMVHKLYVVDPEEIVRLLEDRSFRRRIEEVVEMLESLLG